ncbi:MAG: hypothetical protein JWM32_2976 [Verrucomicrobia bacterium]|nr:hypothetical protein [Verrucomicrobiota bacterium]
MDKTLRAKMLRERLDAVRGYSLPPLPHIAKPKREIKRRFFRNFIHLAVGQHVREVPQLWVIEKDAKPEPTVKSLRTARKSPLIRIAELYPVRLSRRYR